MVAGHTAAAIRAGSTMRSRAKPSCVVAYDRTYAMKMWPMELVPMKVPPAGRTSFHCVCSTASTGMRERSATAVPWGDP